MSDTPETMPLCRYEELARRENRLRKAKVSASITATDQLTGTDDLESDGVDIPNRLSCRND